MFFVVGSHKAKAPHPFFALFVFFVLRCSGRGGVSGETFRGARQLDPPAACVARHHVEASQGSSPSLTRSLGFCENREGPSPCDCLPQQTFQTSRRRRRRRRRSRSRSRSSGRRRKRRIDGGGHLFQEQAARARQGQAGPGNHELQPKQPRAAERLRYARQKKPYKRALSNAKETFYSLAHTPQPCGASSRI